MVSNPTRAVSPSQLPTNHVPCGSDPHISVCSIVALAPGLLSALLSIAGNSRLTHGNASSSWQVKKGLTSRFISTNTSECAWILMGGADEDKYDHPTQEPVGTFLHTEEREFTMQRNRRRTGSRSDSQLLDLPVGRRTAGRWPSDRIPTSQTA